jgi:hypothetical protein
MTDFPIITLPTSQNQLVCSMTILKSLLQIPSRHSIAV